MKKSILFAAAMALVLGAYAETDYQVLRDVQILQQDMGRAEAAIDAIEAGTSNLGGLTVSGDATFDSSSTEQAVTFSSDYTIRHAPHYIAVTNGQVLSHVAGIYRVAASDVNVTCTVADASAAGDMFTIYNTGTGIVSFADGGNLKLVGAAALAQDGMLGLYSVDGTNWWQSSKCTD